MAGRDVFLSYNSKDAGPVVALAHGLREHGVDPWLDRWDIGKGTLWMPQIQAVASTLPTAVCVGPNGLGPWQDHEVQAALMAAIDQPSRPVHVVLLPGGPDPRALPPFLRGRNAVDLRTAWEAGVEGLARALRGLGARSTFAAEARPYRGLDPFTEATARWLYGREREVAELLEHLRRQRLLLVVGASGSGKSSLARAGLVPAIRAGDLDGRLGWAEVMRPGVDPIEALARALVEVPRASADLAARTREVQGLAELFRRDPTGLATTGRLVADAYARANGADHAKLVLVVDQLEELFTTSGEAARSAFLAALLQVAESDAPVRIVATLRADFLSRCLSVPALARRLQDAVRFALPPLSASQLRDAIVRPALAAGGRIDETVVRALVAATEDAPGQLPLLQHTLAELWKRRDAADRVTLEVYDALGGIEGAIARTAEEVLASSGVPEETFRAVFGRLVVPGLGTGDTRRRARLDEFGPEARVVVDLLVDARLLTVDAEHVEVAHEALVREWARLQGWVEGDREALRLARQIGEAVTEKGEPWRGAKLDRAVELFEAGDPRLSEAEHAFLAACVAQRDAERAREDARRRAEIEAAEELARVRTEQAEAEAARARAEAARAEAEGARALSEAARADAEAKRAAERLEQVGRLRWALGGVAAALVAVAGASVLTVMVAQRMVDLALRESARDLAARAATHEEDPLLALLLALASVDRAWTSEGSMVLADAIAATGFYAQVPSPVEYPYEVATPLWRPDGTRVVSRAGNATLQLWRASGEALPPVPVEGPIEEVHWSSDGRWILVGGDGFLEVRRGDDGALDRELDPLPDLDEAGWTPAGQPWAAGTDQVVADDDRYVGTATLRVWDAGTGSGSAAAWSVSWDGGVARSVAWNPGSEEVAVLNGSTLLMGRRGSQLSTAVDLRIDGWRVEWLGPDLVGVQVDHAASVLYERSASAWAEVGPGRPRVVASFTGGAPTATRDGNVMPVAYLRAGDLWVPVPAFPAEDDHVSVGDRVPWLPVDAADTALAWGRPGLPIGAFHGLNGAAMRALGLPSPAEDPTHQRVVVTTPRWWLFFDARDRDRVTLRADLIDDNTLRLFAEDRTLLVAVDPAGGPIGALTSMRSCHENRWRVSERSPVDGGTKLTPDDLKFIPIMPDAQETRIVWEVRTAHVECETPGAHPCHVQEARSAVRWDPAAATVAPMGVSEDCLPNGDWVDGVPYLGAIGYSIDDDVHVCGPDGRSLRPLPTYAAALSADGRWVVGLDHWELPTQARRWEVDSGASEVLEPAAHATGWIPRTLLAWVAAPGKVMIDGAIERIVEGPNRDAVPTVTPTRDGLIIDWHVDGSGAALVDASGTVRGALPPTCTGSGPRDPDDPRPHGSGSRAPDGTRIACGGGDAVTVHDAVDGHVLATLLTGNASNVPTFSPDGELILTTGRDRAARVWRVADGLELSSFAPPPDNDGVRATFTRDSRHLLIEWGDQYVRRYPVERTELLRIARTHAIRELTEAERRVLPPLPYPAWAAPLFE